MSLRAVHAGTGYQYLLRSVATHDAPKESGQALSDYYAAKGTPPGRWIGSGLDGLASHQVRSGAQVTASQMAALYGEGLHPDTDDMLAAGATLGDCKIGRSFPIYTAGVPVLQALAAAEKQFRDREKRLPDASERSLMAEQIGRPFYLEDGGVDHASGADVIAWVNRQRDAVRQAVAGFDFTFSPVKSVSVLWALADERTASLIAALHHEAVAETLAWAEDNAVYTRQGAGGIEQVRTRGLIAAEFTHFDTRCGDPDLHSHVLVANKVQAPDGSWKALDSKAIFQMHQALSARYNTALQDRLTRRMGLEFTARHPSPDKAPVWEVAGVDPRLCEAFSSRRALARPVYDRMVADYVDRTGRQPSQRASYALWQQAILETRDAKKPAASLAEHRQVWRDTAARIVGVDGVDRVVEQARTAAGSGAQRPLFDADRHTAVVAAEAVAAVTAKRPQFRRSHIDTAVSVALKGYRFANDDHRRAAADRVVAAAMDSHAVMLTPPEMLDLPAALTTDSGAGVDRRANSEQYTTRAVLAAEQAVLDGCCETVPVFATDAEVDAALRAHRDRSGWALNDGQEHLVRHLVTGGQLVAAGVGPAGTGKTASMAVVADTWRRRGGRVIGLAPSAAAASVLSGDIDAEAVTIDSLVFTWTGGNPHAPAGQLDALPVAVRPGDMLLVDEAGMASTGQLAALVDIARRAGAVVRMVGDPAQLSAVAGGGIFSEVCRTPGTPELTQVMRMGADTEQADATLGVRRGDPAALEVYDRRGWITGGAREQMLTDAVQGYLADTGAGRSSLVIAATNTDVDTLNEVLRGHHIACGDVDTRRQATGARGDVIGVGDRVIARRNEMLRDTAGRPAGRVINGQLFTVTGIAGDGSLAVRDTRDGREMTLPADYVRRSVHLGYAATVHRAQGATVDTTHAVIDTSMDRAGLYVAMTRGRKENRIYTVCEAGVDPFAEDGHLHSAGDEQAPTARQVAEAVLARDTRQRSATETLRDEHAAATSSERRDALFRHGRDIAVAAYTDHAVAELADQLPRVTARTIADDPEQLAAVRAAVAAAAGDGIDLTEHWLALTEGIETADVPGRALAARIHHHTTATAGGDRGAGSGLPPRFAGDDSQLRAWLDTVADEQQVADTRLADLVEQYRGVHDQIADTLARHLLAGRVPETFIDGPRWADARRILAVAAATGDPADIVATALADTGDRPFEDRQFTRALLRRAQQQRGERATELSRVAGAYPLPQPGEGIDPDLHARARTLMAGIEVRCADAAATAARGGPWQQAIPAARGGQHATERDTLIAHIAVWRQLHDLDDTHTEPLPATDDGDRLREGIAARLGRYEMAVAAADDPVRAVPDSDLAAEIAFLERHRHQLFTEQLIAQGGYRDTGRTHLEQVEAKIAELTAQAEQIAAAEQVEAARRELARQAPSPIVRARLADLDARARQLATQLPPPAMWRGITARAADTDAHARQLAEARAADRQQTAQQQRVQAEMDRLDARVATYRGEQDRRARLSPEDRRAEDQYRARQTPEPLAPPPTPGATASVEASPHSTRDTDTGPAL